MDDPAAPEAIKEVLEGVSKCLDLQRKHNVAAWQHCSGLHHAHDVI
jgi:hypothetical protein